MRSLEPAIAVTTGCNWNTRFERLGHLTATAWSRPHPARTARWPPRRHGAGRDVDAPVIWHGNTVTVNGIRMDVVSLLPASMVVADMVPDNIGTWIFHCHVNDHILAGMLTRYKVTAWVVSASAERTPHEIERPSGGGATRASARNAQSPP